MRETGWGDMAAAQILTVFLNATFKIKFDDLFWYSYFGYVYAANFTRNYRF